jgi:hypothetical protein
MHWIQYLQLNILMVDLKKGNKNYSFSCLVSSLCVTVCFTCPCAPIVLVVIVPPLSTVLTVGIMVVGTGASAPVDRKRGNPFSC